MVYLAVSKKDSGSVLADNRRAFHEYFIEETHEAGMVLSGTEIKSIREGRINLRDGYVRPERGELWLHNVHISPYDKGNIYNHKPTAPRKLLMHKREIAHLASKVQEKGLTLVPLRVYIKNDVAKVAVGVARGKKQYDKRDAVAERDAKRDIERAMKVYA